MAHSPTSSGKREKLSLVEMLEHGDGYAHVFVSILLLLLAVAVLVNSTVSFVRDVLHTDLTRPESGTDFVKLGVIFLSDLLFGVIVLELLSTILTYIRARSLEATIKAFLIVGLISSIRKILLIGAQASTKEAPPDAFVKEALGTLLSILGIVVLIGGLLMLDYRVRTKAVPQEPTE